MPGDLIFSVFTEEAGVGDPLFCKVSGLVPLKYFFLYNSSTTVNSSVGNVVSFQSGMFKSLLKYWSVVYFKKHQFISSQEREKRNFKTYLCKRIMNDTI